MEQQKVVEPLLDEEEELVGAAVLKRRPPRPAKNLFDASHVSYGFVNMSTITDEEEDPEPKPEPQPQHVSYGFVNMSTITDEEEVPEPEPQHFSYGFVNMSTITDEEEDPEPEPEPLHGHPAADAARGNGIGGVGDEEVLQTKPSREEEEEVYDLRAKKPDHEEGPIKNFHEIRDQGVGDLGDLTEEKSYQEKTAVSLIDETEPEETEFDVEGVLEKQNTHDLYCPNCWSCITRKVILVRKTGVVFPPEPNASIPEAEAPSPDATPVSDPQRDAAEDRGDNRQPEVFRCLSCFTFFIPKGDGFKLFRFFQKRGEPESVPEGEEVPAVAPEGSDSGMANDSLPSDNDVTPEPKKVDEGSVDSSPQGKAGSRKEPPLDTRKGFFPSPPEKSENGAVKVPEEPTKKNTGGRVIIPTERAPADVEAPLADVENPLQAETQPLLDETRPTAAPEAREFDILKSIVYGGLVESVTSLGVVSSAAGGGAATLNTLALAMANLISGLFVLVHNLRDLKNEQYDLAQTRTDVDQDRYFQNLGRRGKFGLHATVAVLSYLVFGLVAPITYGFSFRESDDRDYKLAALAGASLLCILALALVKAHVRSKSYLKTGLYYLMMGVTASGISFLVGVLIDKLLAQLGLFNTGSTSTSLSGVLSSISVSGSGRASY